MTNEGAPEAIGPSSLQIIDATKRSLSERPSSRAALRQISESRKSASTATAREAPNNKAAKASLQVPAPRSTTSLSSSSPLSLA